MHINNLQWLFLVAYNPPIGRKNVTYIPLIVLAFWKGYISYLSHRLWEPETTIETLTIFFVLSWLNKFRNISTGRCGPRGGAAFEEDG